MKQLTGTLSVTDFLKVRNLIWRHATLEFQPRKASLMLERQTAYKLFDWDAYIEKITTANQSFALLQKTMTGKALAKLHLTEDAYEEAQLQIMTQSALL
jgi:hypothetical protein